MNEDFKKAATVEWHRYNEYNTNEGLDSEAVLTWEFATAAKMTFDEMHRAVMHYIGYPESMCHHSHDCCGCWFPQSQRLYRGGQGNTWMIREVWQRNY